MARKLLTKEELFLKYNKIISDITNMEYELLGAEYKKTKSRENNVFIFVHHISCGNKYWVHYSSFINSGNRCYKCKDKYKQLSKEENFKRYKEKFNKYPRDGYELLDVEYRKMSNGRNGTFLKIYHDLCGESFWIEQMQYFNGKQCDCIFRRIESRKLHYNKLLRELNEPDYELLDVEFVYKNKNMRTYLHILHKSCGNDFWLNQTYFFKKGQRCIECTTQSKLEHVIANHLKESNINYEIQKTFEDCSYKKPLRYDFYLYDYNMLIEAQGHQHYQVVQFGGMELVIALKCFISQQRRDNIKRDYCKKNNIRLLEIPYWDEKRIPEILSEVLGINTPRQSPQV